jgi:hypothetical protein
MGEYDGDAAALEAAFADDDAARAFVADEARFEGLLREAATAATFCPGCDDLVRGTRCDACGAAIKPGGYVVERVLVSNAHGRMYIARDADGTQVALKELAFVQSPTLEVLAAFDRETKFLRALEHPAIPRFVASFEEGTGIHVRYYLAQELVIGESLDARLEEHWYSEAEIVDIARKVLAVLVYLQSVSPMVIHRDIKPANLLRRADGSIAVVDFGAAHVQGATAGSTSIGTFGYMPIEQLAGQVDATTDPYALGASLLQLLSRREPWRILQGVDFDGINVSPALRELLTKLVAPEPRDRFPDAAAALAALDAPAKPAAKPGARVRGWWRPVAVAAASIMLVLSGVGGYALIARTPAPPEDYPVVAPPGTATLRFALDLDMPVQLLVDGKQVASVRDNDEVPVAAGMREVEIVGPDNQRCRHSLRLAAGQTTTFECHLVEPLVGRDELEDAIPPGKQVSIEVKEAPIREVLRIVTDQCGVNLAVPDSIDDKVTLRFKDAPCDQAFEVLLESRGLWYRYDKDSKVVRVAQRVELDRERGARAERKRLGVSDDALPRGNPVDLDFVDAPIHVLMQLLAGAGSVNIVVPDEIDAKVTVRMKAVPWDLALGVILETHGLWYRYRPKSKLMRIAPRVELDREDAAARERANQR